MDRGKYTAYFLSSHTSLDVGFVGENEKTCSHKSLLEVRNTQLQLWTTYLFKKQSRKLFATVSNSQPVCGVHHPYQGICLLEVVPPVRSEGLLTSHIPSYPVSWGT